MATWTTKTDNVDDVSADHINTIQTEKLDRDGQIPLTGAFQWDKGIDVASAGTLTLGNDGNYFDITGTTGITGITQTAVGGSTVQAGTVVKLHFDGAVTLTHSANLFLPGSADITTAAGDELEFACYDTDKWRCTKYSPAGTMDVKRGGTGLATITDHGVLLGSGTGAVTPTAVGATGEYLAGSTGADAVWATLNQAAVAGLTTASAPAFTSVKLTDLTDGYIPYHVNDSTGLANSAVRASASTAAIGIDAQANAYFYLSGDLLSGAAQYGFVSDGIFSGTSQTNVLFAGGTAKASTAVTIWAGLRIEDAGLGSGASIATQYGIYIGDLTRGGTAIFPVYSVSNQPSYFGGAVRIGNDTAVGSEKLLVAGQITLLQNSDTITLSHDGSDAYFKTSDGSFIFQTDEGTNTDTVVYVDGKGSGVGVVDADYLRARTTKTPATAGADGTTGDIVWDSGFIYVCVAANTWKKTAIATW